MGCQSQRGSSIWWVLHLAESEKCEPVFTWSLGVSKIPPRITHFAMVLTVQEKTTKMNSIRKAKGQNRERGSLREEQQTLDDIMRTFIKAGFLSVALEPVLELPL